MAKDLVASMKNGAHNQSEHAATITGQFVSKNY